MEEHPCFFSDSNTLKTLLKIPESVSRQGLCSRSKLIEFSPVKLASNNVNVANCEKCVSAKTVRGTAAWIDR